jgi:hypothetical protein
MEGFAVMSAHVRASTKCVWTHIHVHVHLNFNENHSLQKHPSRAPALAMPSHTSHMCLKVVSHTRQLVGCYGMEPQSPNMLHAIASSPKPSRAAGHSLDPHGEGLDITAL